MEQQNTTSQQESDSHITLKSILGGDILAHSFLKRQANLLILIVLLTILYIDNRYSSQQELIEIDRLKKELTDIKYDALTISSELTERSRQSPSSPKGIGPMWMHCCPACRCATAIWNAGRMSFPACSRSRCLPKTCPAWPMCTPRFCTSAAW